MSYASVNGGSVSITLQKSSTLALSCSFTSQKVDNLSGSFAIQRSDSVAISASFYPRFASAVPLSTNFTVRWGSASSAGASTSITVNNVSTADLTTSLWVNKASYKVELIRDGVILKDYGPLSHVTDDDYQTVLEEDVLGYGTFSILVAAGAPNDITYRIQACPRLLPSVWAGIPNQVDKDVSASDPENMGTIATFTGQFAKLRVQAKNKTPGSDSRAWASLKAKMG